jgi:hypothetical protein
MTNATDNSNEPAVEDDWQPMSAAILAKRLPPRILRPRIRYEHMVVWVKRGQTGFWYSRTVRGFHFSDEDFVGWKPVPLAE